MLVSACHTITLILYLLKTQIPLASGKKGIFNHFFLVGNDLTQAVARVFTSKVLMLFQYGSRAINTLKGQLCGKKLAYLETDLWF